MGNRVVFRKELTARKHERGVSEEQIACIVGARRLKQQVAEMETREAAWREW